MGDNLPTVTDADVEVGPAAITDAELETQLSETPETETTPEPEVVPVPKQEFEALKKKVEHQELFIQRQGTEVGELRKLRDNLVVTMQRKRAEAQDSISVNPIAAMDAHAEAQVAAQQIQSINIQEAIQINKNQILTAIPDYQSRIQDIATEAKSMGVPEPMVQQYLANPYATPVGVLLPYIKAAELRKQFTELQKKQAPQTEKVMQNITNAAKRGTTLTAKASSSTKSGTQNLSSNDIAMLSEAELDRLLNS
jgi:hypothetical protein